MQHLLDGRLCVWKGLAMTHPLFDAARRYASAGLSLIPTQPSTKQPYAELLPQACLWPPPAEGTVKERIRPTWKPFQAARADESEIRRWVTHGAQLAIVGGKVSGGLVIFDFDIPAFYTDWCEKVGPLAAELPTQKTGSGGYHVFFRCANPGNNDKLAWSPDETEETGRTIAIETRGEGGYVIVAPSIHPSGNQYTMIQGDLADVPTLADDTAAMLFEAARSLNQAPYTRDQLESIQKRQRERQRERTSTERSSQGSIIDDYTGRVPIEEALQAYGYVQTYHDRWARPGGKNPSVVLKDGKSHHFNTNDPMCDNNSHDAFDLFCIFEHGGDVRRAVRAAYDAGYGERSESPTPMQPSEGHGGASDGRAPELRRFHRSDQGNAERFIADHGQHVRYVGVWGKWLIWDGTRWAIDETYEIYRLAATTVKRMWAEVGALADGDPNDKTDPRTKEKKEWWAWCIACENKGKMEAMIEVAKTIAGIAIKHTQLDTNAWLLNCCNGTLNLRTGQLQKHRPEDLITKRIEIDFDPTAKATTWETFITRVMGEKADELVPFVRRAIGYALTGDVSEQCLFFAHGKGHNGKSVFFNTLAALLGDYQQKAPTEMIMAKLGTGGSIPNDVARLMGCRFVVTAEIEEGRRLAEALVKDLTSDDTIIARYLHKEFFEFPPTHKLFMYGNHKPIIRGTDPGIWRRIRLIPFQVTIPAEERDPQLGAKLKAELAGILNWAMAGCLEWQDIGLRVPQCVQDAVADYRAEMDTLGGFIEDTCVTGPAYTVRASELYAGYSKWCDDTGEFKITQRRFGMQLTERGYDRFHSRRGFSYIGIGLLTPPDGSDNGPDMPPLDGECDPCDPCDPKKELFSESKKGSDTVFSSALNPVSSVTRITRITNETDLTNEYCMARSKNEEKQGEKEDDPRTFLTDTNGSVAEPPVWSDGSIATADDIVAMALRYAHRGQYINASRLCKYLGSKLGAIEQAGALRASINQIAKGRRQ